MEVYILERIHPGIRCHKECLESQVLIFRGQKRFEDLKRPWVAFILASRHQQNMTMIEYGVYLSTTSSLVESCNREPGTQDEEAM